MKYKDEVLDHFIDWKKNLENQTGRKVKILRSDNGGEYANSFFRNFCSQEGITHHFTVRETPQQNGVAERMNRTLLEKVQCMLSNSGLAKSLWAEAIVYATHLVNRLPSSALEGKTPMEVWSGEAAKDYERLRVFGCDAYYHIKEDKLNPRSKKAIFIGFRSGVKGFKLWDPMEKKVVMSRDVIFNENKMFKIEDQAQKEEKRTAEIYLKVKENVADGTSNHEDSEDSEIENLQPEDDDIAPINTLNQVEYQKARQVD